MLPRELRQTQGEPRVRDDVRPVVREADRLEAVAQRVGLSGPEAVAAMELRERDPLVRILGMEVEWEPRDFGVELAPCLLGCDLAEPAERSDVVAPDDDRMFSRFGVEGRHGRIVGATRAPRAPARTPRP